MLESFLLSYFLVSGIDSQSLITGYKFYCNIRSSQTDIKTLPYICKIIEAAKDFNEHLIIHRNEIIIGSFPIFFLIFSIFN